MTIHREGHKLLIFLLLALFGFNSLLFYQYPEQTLLTILVMLSSVVLFLLILQFFRNPKISVSKDEKYILAPADGKVVVIEDITEEEYFKGKRKQISIFMSPVNVHVNRNPISGVVKYFKYHPGKYLVAWHPKSSTLNERTTVVIEAGNGKEVLVRQIAGALARRIKWYIKSGDAVKQGEEFGFIKFGSRLDVILPVDVNVKVIIGEISKGGRTILAEFV